MRRRIHFVHGTSALTSSSGAEDIRVTGVEDSHGRATIEFSTGSSQFNLNGWNSNH
jgi:hypothetical protein